MKTIRDTTDFDYEEELNKDRYSKIVWSPEEQGALVDIWAYIDKIYLQLMWWSHYKKFCTKGIDLDWENYNNVLVFKSWIEFEEFLKSGIKHEGKYLYGIKNMEAWFRPEDPEIRAMRHDTFIRTWPVFKRDVQSINRLVEKTRKDALMKEWFYNKLKDC